MKTFEEKIREIRKQIKILEDNQSLKEERRLPSNCYFLESDTIISYGRKDGEARYPYAYDGLTFWAYESGNVKMEESTLSMLLHVFEGKEPYLAFFAGIKQPDGSYFPISLLGTAKQPTEKDVKRYTVFTPQAVYYFTDVQELHLVVRILIDDKKLFRISFFMENASMESIETYLSTYMNFFMMQKPCESLETKWFKQCTATDYGFLMHTTETRRKQSSLENYAAITYSDLDGVVEKTTSRRVYTGSVYAQLNCAESLFRGGFDEEKLHTEFSETAIAGTILPKLIEAGKSFEITYTVAFGNDKKEVESRAVNNKKANLVDEYIFRKASGVNGYPEIKFGDLQNANLKSFTVNSFIENVLRQVEFCARAKNYAGPFIGVRDIFQQLEAYLIWNPSYTRQKIIEAIGFIGEDGRAPRQYSYPQSKNVLPAMDLRPFIDQGVWIISTVFSYLAYTDDYSILDEVCGYYKFNGNSVAFSEERDTVLEHLVRITEYLVSNLATDTGCLRALYGDWNDALDGLGYTIDKNREYGDGVSVMATLQLYRNLREMCQLFEKTGKHTDKIRAYQEHRRKIQEGLQTHAIVSNENGERKIVHGWGDKLCYKIASYCDNDKVSRDGLTSNAFWVLCGALDWDISLKEDILQAYSRLDSKYGLKTFEPYFAEDNQEVGRIIKLPKGTAENGATYIHATLFGILSLFEMGESEKAWEQLYKILPLTHKTISTTPFIMSNSYIYNEEKGLDGESMNDWFTGSGCVLIKALVGGAFGVCPSLNGLAIRPAQFFPCDIASIKLRIKNCDLFISYKHQGDTTRRFIVNGKEKQAVRNEKNGLLEIDFTAVDLTSKEIQIEIFDE